MRKTVLFVTYGGGHAHMVYPVVHALRKSPEAPSLDLRVLGLPAATAILAANQVDSFGFRDYLDPQQDADAVAWGRALAKDHHSPTIGADLEDSVAYLGLCYKDLVTRLGAAGAEKAFKDRARQSFFPVTILERVFDRVRPDLVVATNSPRTEAAAIEVANRRGIDSLIMADLFTGMGDYPLQARSITFLNEVARDMFTSDGLVDGRRSRLHVTGNPAFDRLLTVPAGRDPEWIRRQFPQAAGRTLVLHADMPGYWHPGEKRSYLRSPAEILEELGACYDAAMANDAEYLVRPHPSQDRAFYATWLKGRPHAALAADCGLHDLLRNVDLVVARTTTVGLEAAILRKRVLQINCDFHTDFPLAKMGIAWGVNAFGELPGAIRSALTDDRKLEEIRTRVDRLLPREPAGAKIAGILLRKLNGVETS